MGHHPKIFMTLDVRSSRAYFALIFGKSLIKGTFKKNLKFLQIRWRNNPPVIPPVANHVALTEVQSYMKWYQMTHWYAPETKLALVTPAGGNPDLRRAFIDWPVVLWKFARYDYEDGDDLFTCDICLQEIARNHIFVGCANEHYQHLMCLATRCVTNPTCTTCPLSYMPRLADDSLPEAPTKIE